MGTVVVNPDTSLIPPTLFGCAFRNLSVQLGFNNNPTTFTTGVVRDIGQTFSLKALADQGIYSMQNIQLGSIDEWAIVESWEESEVDVSGSGVFSVKLSDTRLVLESVNIMTGSLNLDSFLQTRPNILVIKELDIDSLQEALDGKIFTFRGQNFQVNVDEFTSLDFSDNVTEPRTGGGGGIGSAPPTNNCPEATTRFEYKGVAEGGQTIETRETLETTEIQRAIDFQTKLLSGKPAGERLRIQRKIDRLQSTLLRQQVLDRTSNVDPGVFTGLQLTDIGADTVDDPNPIRGLGGSTTPFQPIQFTLTLKDMINQLTESIGSVDWFVSTTKNGDIFTITIRLIQRSLLTDANDDIDIIAQQHVGKVIKKKVGTENNPNSGKSQVVFGGLKKTLTEFTTESIKPFWGFDETGVPFTQPTIRITDQTFKATEEELSQAITNQYGLLAGINRTIPFSKEDVNLIKSYADEFWGRQFYIEIDGSDIDVDGAPFLNAVKKAWFEGDQTPDNVGIDLQDSFRFSDGRWPVIVKTPQKTTWNDSTLRLNNVLFVKPGVLYISAEASIENEFIIIRLITVPTFTDPTSELSKKSRIDALAKAWVPIEDARERYGPWTNDETTDVVFDGIEGIEIDDGLTPWRFRIKNLTNTAALESLDNIAIQRLGFFKPQSRTLQTITLEVADLPKFTIGQLFQGGSAINSLSIQFGTSRITTTYIAKTFTLNLQQKIVNAVSGNSTSRKIDRLEKDCDEEEDRRERPDPPGVVPDEPDFDENEEIFLPEETTCEQKNWLGLHQAPDNRFMRLRSGLTGYNSLNVFIVVDIPNVCEGISAPVLPEILNVTNIKEPKAGTDNPQLLKDGSFGSVTLYNIPKTIGSIPSDVDSAVVKTGDVTQVAIIDSYPSPQIGLITGHDGRNYEVTLVNESKNYTGLINEAENPNSPGYLLDGEEVIVKVDAEGDYFISKTPTIFAIPEN